MFINPYESLNNPGRWMKANFHTHAGTGPNTCGAYEIDDVVRLYKEAGYDVLAITNHDCMIDVGEYQSKYDILLFNGFEYSQDRHMLCIDADRTVFGNHQDVLDEVGSMGGFSILCHPNWIVKEYWPWEEISKLSGYTGIEVYNSVIFRLNGTGLAADTWDYLLSRGSLVWGFADDDFHRWFDLARSWNVVYAPARTREDVKAAIIGGCFYATTGLVLNSFSLEDGVIALSAGLWDSYVKDNEYRFIGKDGQILDIQHGESGKYRIKGDETYIRVQVVSEHGAMLWTQPVYDGDLLSRP